MASLYRKCPQLSSGTHYWSVSWLPESQREVLKDKNLNDDSALLGIGKRILSKFTQAVPSNVAFAVMLMMHCLPPFVIWSQTVT